MFLYLKTISGKNILSVAVLVEGAIHLVLLALVLLSAMYYLKIVVILAKGAGYGHLVR
tara:strand:- start:3181 stop:3354 length:174 start_codon:yes stop_codon:yes gene_type:complete